MDGFYFLNCKPLFWKKKQQHQDYTYMYCSQLKGFNGIELFYDSLNLHSKNSSHNVFIIYS